MSNDNFFKNIKSIEEFLGKKDSILKNEKKEIDASKWVTLHHKYVEDKSINPLRYYAGVLYRDPRVMKMLPLAQELNRKMNEINKDNEEIDKMIDNCNKFLCEFGKACGYFEFELNESVKYEKTNFYNNNIVDKVQHSDRYEFLKNFEEKLNHLKGTAIKPKGKSQDTQSKNNIKENEKIVLNEFKENVLPKIETALVLYKPPISENFNKNNITVSHQAINSSDVKKLVKNNDKNSTALTVWKPPISKKFEDSEQLKQCIINNFSKIKRLFSNKSTNSNDDVSTKQFIVKNFSEIKKAFNDENDHQKIRRCNTLNKKIIFKDDDLTKNENKTSEKEEKNSSDQTKQNQKNKKIKNNNIPNLEHEKEEIFDEDKIAVKELDLNSVQITYYRALISLFQSTKNSLIKIGYSDLSNVIAKSDPVTMFNNLKEFNKKIEGFCKENAKIKSEANMSIMKAIKKAKVSENEFKTWKSNFDNIKKVFTSVAECICNKSKTNNINKIYSELWQKTERLVNFRSEWENESTKNFFEMNKKTMNSDNIRSLKALYYLRRIFEILNKSADEYKGKNK